MSSAGAPLLLAAFALGTGAPPPGAFESPPTFKASALLPPALLKGPHFTVANEVRTDDYFHESRTYETRLIAALHAVKVKGCADYVDTATESETESEAMFFAESAEMLQRLHATTPVVAVLPDSRALVAKTKDGRAMVLVAIDWVRWTAAAQNSALEFRQRAKDELGATRLELQLTGRVSDRARRELEALGYKITERVPRTLQTSTALNPAK